MKPISKSKKLLDLVRNLGFVRAGDVVKLGAILA